MANDLLRGRQTVLSLTNKSGGGVVAGDVVILDTANDEAFTTTTTSAYAAGSVGVALETIASNGVGRVCSWGYVPIINLNASATRGYFVKTHTVAKQGTGSATIVAGVFAQVLKTSSTPSAWLFGGLPFQGTGGGGGGAAVGYGTFASKPSAGTAGQLWTPSDGVTQWVDDGSAWRPIINGQIGTAPPAAASWTKQDYNSASGTLTDVGGAVLLKNTGHDGTDRPTVAYKTVPVGNYVVSCYLDVTSFGKNYNHYGMLVRDNTGAMVMFDIIWNGQWFPNISVANTSGVITANYNDTTNDFSNRPYNWLRIQDNGTNRIYFVSQTGNDNDWVQIFSHGRTTGVTATGIGFYGNARNSAGTQFDMLVTCKSWKEA